MLLTMNSKQYLERFVPNNKPKIVLNTQYVIISRKIKTSHKHRNIISANVLFPDNSILSEYTVDGDLNAFFDSYMEQLVGNMPLLATLIKGVIEEKFNIIFMCTKTEEKLGYLDSLRYFIESTFHFPIYKYKKDKVDKSKYEKYDKKKILKRCNKILQNAEADQLKALESTAQGRKKIISKMDKKDMQKKLKKLGVVGIKDMNKSEMKEYLEEFYIYE